MIPSTNNRKGWTLELAALLGYAMLYGYALYKGNGTIQQVLNYLSVGLLGFYVLLFQKKYLIPALLISVPLSVSMNIGGGFAMGLPSEGLTALLVLLVVFGAIQKPTLYVAVLRHPIVILFLLEFVWMIICSVLANQPEVGFKRSFVRFSFIAIFLVMLVHWFESVERRMYLFVLYAVGAVWPIIHGMIFHARFNFSTFTAYWMPKPFFADHTVYGACLAFVIPALLLFVVYMRRLELPAWFKILLVVLLVLFIAAEILSFSRAAWVSLAAASVFALLIRFRVRFWMLISLLGVVMIFFFANQNKIMDAVRHNEAISNKGGLSDHILSVANVQTDASNLERINRWNCAVRMAKERPIFGFGPGSYQFEYGRFQIRADMTHISTFSGNRGHAHSEFFNALSETGILGAVFVLVIMFVVIGYGMRVIYETEDPKQRLIALGALLGLVTFYVHGFFNAFLDNDKMSVLVFGSIAVLIATDIFNRKKSTVSSES